MRVETCTALAVILLFFFPGTSVQAEESRQPGATVTEGATVGSDTESRSADTAVVAQAPAGPDEQVFRDIKVYPCF